MDANISQRYRAVWLLVKFHNFKALLNCTNVWTGVCLNADRRNLWWASCECRTRLGGILTGEIPTRRTVDYSLENRKNAHLLLFYKGHMAFLSAIPCDLLRRPVRNSRFSDS